MNTYKFSPDTKEFIYAEDAFLDPLESEKQGKEIYLLPANSTFTAPPAAKEGFAIVWNGEAWEYIEDHRGVTVWRSYDESMVIKELGAIPDGWTVDRPVKPTTKSELTEFLYQEKCKVAYGGVTVVKGGTEYLFETSQDSITMCNSMALAMASQGDDYTVTWKVWAGDNPVMLTITKAEFTAIFAFGMLMINTAFGVEGALNEQAQSFTDEQLANADYVEAFKANAVEQLAAVNTVFSLDPAEDETGGGETRRYNT